MKGSIKGEIFLKLQLQVTSITSAKRRETVRWLKLKTKSIIDLEWKGQNEEPGT